MQDKRVHGAGTMGHTVYGPEPTKSEKMKGMSDVVDMHIDGPTVGASEDNAEDWNGFNSTGCMNQGVSLQFFPPVQLPVSSTGLPQGSVRSPEGRVHGGSLMAMLTGKSGLTQHQE